MWKATKLALLAWLTCIASMTSGADAPRKPAASDSLEKDFAAELPPSKPTLPDDALKTFRLRAGFHMELVASEPHVLDPMAIAIDENGRMFVVELTTYNQYASTGPARLGTIRLLEDTDGDGRYDKSTIFVDNLAYPSAVACYDGGIFVGAVPDLLYCKDTDGDGKADVREKVLTGFADDRGGEGMLNSFHWCFDNRLHISTGTNGGMIQAVARPDEKPVSVRGQNILFDPRTRRFELTSGGGQHGMGIDDWGRTFVCRNSDPAEMLAYDTRYLAHNPYFEAPAASVNIAPGGKNTQLFRISPLEPWRVLRTRLRSKGVVKGSDEGGKVSGFFTAATGITVYRGDAWPAQYRGNLFVGEVANNLVYRARPEPNGAIYTAVRADANAEFLASTDMWFRPAQFANAPDGTLYAIDMYRELIEGAAFLPPQIVKHLDATGGNDRGRIYRIAPDGFKARPAPALGKASTAQLVAFLEHANGWHRDTASRLLYERNDRGAVPLLKQLVANSKLPQARLHAMYALDGFRALDETQISIALASPSAELREAGIRLAEKFVGIAPPLQTQFVKLVSDPSIRVRLQLAFSIASLPREKRTDLITRLLLKDGTDRWIQTGVLSSIADVEGPVFAALLADKTFRTSAAGRLFLSIVGRQIGAANQEADLAQALLSVEQLDDAEQVLRQELIRSLVSKQPAGTGKFATVAGGKGAKLLAGILDAALRGAVDGDRLPAERVAAIQTLALAPFDRSREAFSQLLESRQPQPVQSAAMETLAKFSQPEAARLILEAWPRLSPQLRATATESLFSRATWINVFLDAVEKNEIGRGDVDPARVSLLQSHPDPKIKERAGKIFAGTGLSQRKEVVAAYQPALSLKGDAAQGKALFGKICATCHKLEGVGNSIGADLSAIRDRGTEAILLNILDPNREVKPQFLSYILVNDTGRIITGMITSETANGITIRRADGTSETVLRVNIEELRSTGQSFMPEGLEKQVSIEAMADLLAYLNAAK